MNKELLLAPILLGGLIPTTSFSQNKDKRPNIILFMVDDMGWQDTSVPFWDKKTYLNERYRTPNMEKLAEKGLLFTQAYASSISSPTRCSLISGMNAARHRVTNWTLEKNKTTDGKSKTLKFPDWNYNGLAQVEGTPNTYVIKSFVDILRNSGYHTIHCGKAHFGAIDTPGENPIHFGFEVNIAGFAAGGPASYLSEENFGNRTDGQKSSLFAIPGLMQYWQSGTFLTEALTIEAIKALDKARAYNQPFFLYMSHYAVHVPMMADKRFYQKYKDAGLPEEEARYASMVEGMDKSLGDLMNWLEQTGEDKNTVIIFMSDNGGLSAEGRGGEKHTHNYPLNSGKGSAYEGGIREPMIVYWPNVTPQGKRTDEKVIIEDFFPTILDIAQVKNYKTPQKIDGISFMPLLQGKTQKWRFDRPLFWNFPNLWGASGPGIGPSCTIRQGDYKLIYYYEDGRTELFNIAKDISEKNNLSASMPKKVKELKTKLFKYLKDVDAQMPTHIKN